MIPHRCHPSKHRLYVVHSVMPCFKTAILHHPEFPSSTVARFRVWADKRNPLTLAEVGIDGGRVDQVRAL